MAYKVVMTATEMVAKVKHICFDLNTKYNNKYPFNLGYNHGSYWSWDCWNFYPKTLVWGWNEQIPVGEYQHKNLETGLGDWNGWTILQCCSEISKDFTKIIPAEFMLISDKKHAGCYVGEFERNGKTYNVIECTTSWKTNKVTEAWVDADGTRRNCKGGTAKGKWGWHGKLPWLDYECYLKPLAVDGYWGMATTRYTQKLLGTTVDGIVSGQSTFNKKFLPNAETTSWKFGLIAKGSEMVKALQRLIHADVDGVFGKQSVMKMQEFLKGLKLYDGAIDGYMGANTVKAWQTYINLHFE